MHTHAQTHIREAQRHKGGHSGPLPSGCLHQQLRLSALLCKTKPLRLPFIMTGITALQLWRAEHSESRNLIFVLCGVCGLVQPKHEPLHAESTYGCFVNVQFDRSQSCTHIMDVRCCYRETGCVTLVIRGTLLYCELKLVNTFPVDLFVLFIYYCGSYCIWLNIIYLI